ncbi:MAG: hypothetical protein B5M52_03420 [Helicobacteraceae bacterium 4484_230]|nr:MAG: hypothetical protein B5M52_03420 [Helicobacteraceae bacterium 4484_230]
MYDIPELERKWLSYKIKKTLKPILAVTVLIFAAILVFLFIPSVKIYDSQPEKSVNNNIQKTIVSETSAESSPEEGLKTTFQASSVSSTPPIVAKTKKPVKLEPSFNFMYGLEEEVLGYYDEPTEQKEQMQHRPIEPLQPKAPVNTEPKQDHIVTSKQIGIRSKHETIQKSAEKNNITKKGGSAFEKTDTIEKLDINRKSDEKDIQDVIKRFKKNKNPALSLFVAKRFYAIGNYQQSYNYALITNELNSDIEDSWLIFAKSLVKLDQKEMAISTLESYIESSRSIKAKLLLDSIRNGMMK